MIFAGGPFSSSIQKTPEGRAITWQRGKWGSARLPAPWSGAGHRQANALGARLAVTPVARVLSSPCALRCDR